jgi:hypothetical protein
MFALFRRAPFAGVAGLIHAKRTERRPHPGPEVPPSFTHIILSRPAGVARGSLEFCASPVQLAGDTPVSFWRLLGQARVLESAGEQHKHGRRICITQTDETFREAYSPGSYQIEFAGQPPLRAGLTRHQFDSAKTDRRWAWLLARDAGPRPPSGPTHVLVWADNAPGVIVSPVAPALADAAVLHRSCGGASILECVGVPSPPDSGVLLAPSPAEFFSPSRLPASLTITLEARGQTLKALVTQADLEDLSRSGGERVLLLETL